MLENPSKGERILSMKKILTEINKFYKLLPEFVYNMIQREANIYSHYTVITIHYYIYYDYFFKIKPYSRITKNVHFLKC